MEGSARWFGSAVRMNRSTCRMTDTAAGAYRVRLRRHDQRRAAATRRGPNALRARLLRARRRRRRLRHRRPSGGSDALAAPRPRSQPGSPSCSRAPGMSRSRRWREARSCRRRSRAPRRSPELRSRRGLEIEGGSWRIDEVTERERSVVDAEGGPVDHAVNPADRLQERLRSP